MSVAMHQSMNENMQQCIQNCTECHNTCVTTAAYCLEKGGGHIEASHMRLLQDCAQSCATSADFMLRGSELHPQVCGVCAEACERCAMTCEQFGNDEQMKACAQVCRRCAVSCRQMAGMKI